MPDDLLPPTVAAPVELAPRERERRCDCEFCECTLTTRGEVLKLSDKARKFRDQDERIASLAKDLADEQHAHTKTRDALTAATASGATRQARVAVAGR